MSRLRREAIVAAAREMIDEDGLDALSIRRLAHRVGVSPAAIYLHLTDKRAVLEAVATDELDRLAARVAALDGTDRRAWGRAYADLHVDDAAAHPGLFRVRSDFRPEGMPPPWADAGEALWLVVHGAATAVCQGLMTADRARAAVGAYLNGVP